jgi:AcrR family transcriptional regulator
MLDALCELVAGHGYAGTTVGGIAATAGVSRTTFYEQFETKEDCFRAAYENVAEKLVDAISTASAGIEDKRAQLAAGIDAYLGWFADHPHAAATFVVEVHPAGPEALEQRSNVLERFCRVIDANAPTTRAAASMAVVASIDAMAHDLVRKGRAEDLRSLSKPARFVAEKLLA